MHTPISIVAHTARLVTTTVDRITGDRVEVPLLVAAACQKALSLFCIESRIMYGQAAWIEILENNEPLWAGCWGENYSFWVATQYGEVIDLNASIAHRKRSHTEPGLKSICSPPILWSQEAPKFYRYKPEGVAELDLQDTKDQAYFRQVDDTLCASIPSIDRDAPIDASHFPHESIICPDRRVLDDSRQSFAHFDRVLSVKGIPPVPQFLA